MDNYKLKGLIIGMESFGAQFVKRDNEKIYFDITRSEQLKNEESLLRAKEGFETFGYRLFVKKQNPLPGYNHAIHDGHSHCINVLTKTCTKCGATGF